MYVHALLQQIQAGEPGAGACHSTGGTGPWDAPGAGGRGIPFAAADGCARAAGSAPPPTSSLLPSPPARAPFTAAAPIEAGAGWAAVVAGPALQCFEAATLGMPLEVWKTYLGRNRGVSTLGAAREIYASGGLPAFWAGTSAKMAESASKGVVLMWAKESLLKAFGDTFSPGVAGALAGAGGGIAQTAVIAPATYVVTARVTGGPGESTSSILRRTYAAKGLAGFYPGGSAIAMRQCTNWASRQGFTEAVRDRFKVAFHGGDRGAKLTKTQEIGAGIVGGTLACWNHPIEVVRIEAQAAAHAGAAGRSVPAILRDIVASQGPSGLFKGLVPRIFLGCWQSVCMISLYKIAVDALGG